MNTLKRIINILVSIPFILISIWFISFGFFIGYFTFLLLILTLCFYSDSFAKVFASIVIWFVINIVALPLTLNTYHKTTANYFKRIQKGEMLSFRENCNIYGMNIVLSAGGYLIYHEVAKETFMMMFPCKSGERVFTDCEFIYKSKKLNNAIFKNKNKVVHVAWDSNSYVGNYGEARAAFALNDCYVFKHDNIFIVKGNVKYPEKSNTLILKFPIKIYIQEGLFNYLQKIKWMHPYKVIYKCSY